MALRRLGVLLGRAHAEGLLGTFELALVMRELTLVNNFLTAKRAGEARCAMPGDYTLAVPLM